MKVPHLTDAVKIDEWCSRCNGLLLTTLLQTDFSDTSEPSFLKALRCVNCGSILDSKILRNQSLMKECPVLNDSFIREVAERNGRRRARRRFPISAYRMSGVLRNMAKGSR